MLRPIAAACALLALPLSACSLTEPNRTTGNGSGPVTVTSSDTACTLSSTKVGSGTVTLKIKNTGSKVTEFYLYAEDGTRIVGEIENIGPGLSRDLVVSLDPGSYVSACKPGMTGKGIRAPFTVTDSGSRAGASDNTTARLDRATASYKEYVEDQAGDLLDRTTAFVSAYEKGDDGKARALYPTARVHWERIEPVAESFGDLDPKMDLREADLAPGQAWTGWHRLEKDLWPPTSGYTRLTGAERVRYADDLLANTKTLHDRVAGLSFDVTQIGNGAKSLLDEVATGKVTGEEEAWSHTDLDDFQANVDGAHEGFELLEGILAAKDNDLAEQIDHAFDALQELLDTHRQGDGFVSYATVDASGRKALSDAVNALSEPLSKMTGAITG